VFGEDGAGSSGGRGGGDLFELIFRQKGQKGLGGFYEGPSRLNRGGGYVMEKKPADLPLVVIITGTRVTSWLTDSHVPPHGFLTKCLFFFLDTFCFHE
jgi:hypothetical protein